MSSLSQTTDRGVRWEVVRTFRDTSRAPTVLEVASALSMSVEEIEDAYRRLSADHALVLMEGTTDIRMALPFSAVETAFDVQVHGRRWCDARGVEPGGTIDLDTAWALARAWYRDGLREDWEPMGRDAAQAVLERLGLTGDRWRLPH